MVQNREILYSFYEESECWIFRKTQDSELVWIYIEAGCQELSGSKKGSPPEHPKNANV